MTRWSPTRDSTVVFVVNDRETWGRVVSGPRGPHRIYTVSVADKDRFDVPLVLLNPPRPS